MSKMFRYAIALLYSIILAVPSIGKTQVQAVAEKFVRANSCNSFEIC
ncbi:MAG: hypothetical protein F6J96_08955 [Symploca sp. SIO1C2]|nr:hypothetical protein [Symploca sp. SIO1C2]